MQILLNETEFLNQVLIKGIFNISVHQWYNLQQSAWYPMFPSKVVFYEFKHILISMRVASEFSL